MVEVEEEEMKLSVDIFVDFGAFRAKCWLVGSWAV